MRYKFILDSILTQKSKIRALRCLAASDRKLSIREIAREIKISHPNVSAVLMQLKREEVVNSSRVGRSVIYFLNDGHYLVEKIIRPLFKAEKEAKRNMFKRIKDNLHFSFESIILFGSIVRAEERPDSDIDLAVIISDDSDENEVEQKINGLNPVITKEFGNVLSPIIFKKSDFVKKLKNNDALIRSIVNKGEVIAGKLINEII